MENAMNFRQQAEQYLTEIANRKRDPVTPNTLHVYRSLLDARILPVVGELELADVGNKTAKLLVGRLTEAQLSPATISLAVSLVKQVLKSAVDEDGNQLYPRTWNSDFIDAPKIVKTAQKAPITTPEAVSGAISRTLGQDKALVALLAGTGLRIGEARALMIGPDDGLNSFWDPQAGTLTIRSTVVRDRIRLRTKTEAGKRVVDLDPSLNSFLIGQLGTEPGLVFRNVAGRLTNDRTLRKHLAALGLPGFHSMRRLRLTHLANNNVPGMLVKFWAGHAAGDVTERYTKIGAQIEERKTWSERAGLGFNL
jgi:integrase